MKSETLFFDSAAYTSDAVQRAAYRYSDRLSAEIITRDGEIECRVTFLDPECAAQSDLVDAIVADFRTEVLDQALRERIRAETEPVRNMILALAFSRTGLVEP